MGKNNKKGKIRNLKKRNLSTEKVPSTLHHGPQSARNVVVCPCCNNELIFDKKISELAYCPQCSLFFWNSSPNRPVYSLTSVLSGVKRISSTDILFSDRIPGIVSTVIPNIGEGILEIFRRLSKPEAQTFIGAIQYDEEITDLILSMFVNKVGFDRKKVIEVCNALRNALNKPGINATERSTLSKKYIVNFSSSSTEALKGEKILVQWNVINNADLSYVIVSEKGSTKVKSNGSMWIKPDNISYVTLKVLHKKYQEIIESQTININIVSPPIIHQISTNLSSPVVESEKLKISWNVENADKITLVHHYNDYEKLTVDVTNLGGLLSYTALRTELLELIAERRTSKISKSIMIEVIPLPKISLAEIPQFTNYPDLSIARIIEL